MKFVTAVPDETRFIWELKVMFQNFEEMGIIDDSIAVIGYKNQRPSPEANKLSSRHNIVFVKDSRQWRQYVSIIRPQIMKEFVKRHPEHNVFFYHDSDILFRKLPDFKKLLNDDIWYMSDTVSYIGSEYILSKGGHVMDLMCGVVGIGRETVIKNQDNSGGAQYLVKNTDFRFWEKVERDTAGLYLRLTELKKKFRPRYKDDIFIQEWCCDMWALLWNAWHFGHETRIEKSLSFSWAIEPISEWNKHNIFHNAGVTNQMQGFFDKNKYRNREPFNDTLTCNQNYCTSQYVKAIKRVKRQ